MKKLYRNEDVSKIINDYLKMLCECLVLLIDFFPSFWICSCYTFTSFQFIQCIKAPQYAEMLAEGGAIEALSAIVSLPQRKEITVSLFCLFFTLT